MSCYGQPASSPGCEPTVTTVPAPRLVTTTTVGHHPVSSGTLALTGFSLAAVILVAAFLLVAGVLFVAAAAHRRAHRV